MLVDDTPANLKLLDAVLRTRGCYVRSFTLGALAIDAALADPPDVILLDIAMPGLDGFEVCRRLKRHPTLQDTPVIFLTAMDATVDKIAAFQCGGVDYVTKPFQVEELCARVDTHLRLRALSRELERHNCALDQLVDERTAELAVANRRLSVLDRAKTDFLRMMSHELRTPLNGVLGIGELLVDQCAPGAATDELAGMFYASRERLLSLVENAEVLTRVDTGALVYDTQQVPLEPLLRAAIAETSNEHGDTTVALDGPCASTLVLGDRSLLSRAFKAMFNTARRFAAPTTELRSSCTTDADTVTVQVEARGGCIPSAALPDFFAVISAARPNAGGGTLGLDPPVAHQLFSLFGATLRVENLEPLGVRLTARLKTA